MAAKSSNRQHQRENNQRHQRRKSMAALGSVIAAWKWQWQLAKNMYRQSISMAWRRNKQYQRRGGPAEMGKCESAEIWRRKRARHGEKSRMCVACESGGVT